MGWGETSTPKGRMDIEQLTGFIRHELSKVAALAALDEVLTVVRDSERLVAEATKKLADIERQVQNKSMSLCAMDHEAEAKRAMLEKELADKLADHQALLVKYSKEHVVQDNELRENIGKLQRQEGELTDRVASLTLQVQSLHNQCQAAEKEVERVQRMKEELKASL